MNIVLEKTKQNIFFLSVFSAHDSPPPPLSGVQVLISTTSHRTGSHGGAFPAAAKPSEPGRFSAAVLRASTWTLFPSICLPLGRVRHLLRARHALPRGAMGRQIKEKKKRRREKETVVSEAREAENESETAGHKRGVFCSAQILPFSPSCFKH